MRVVRGSVQLPSVERGAVVTIGNFDGVHLGHQRLIARAQEIAGSLGVGTCVYTFDPYPRMILSPDVAPRQLQSLDQKLATMENLGIDTVILEPFTRDLASKSAEWFAQEVLERRLGASAVVVGWNFQFGRGRHAGVDTLASCMAVPVESLPSVNVDDTPVSSTRIRDLVVSGQVHSAAQLLGRFYVFEGVVSPGDGRGRALGFRTANLPIDDAFVPMDGVYAVRVQWSGGRADGVANIGTRPTFSGTQNRIEVHLLSEAAPEYEQTLTVEFVGRVRDQVRFESAAALQAQIPQDIAAANALLSGPNPW